MLVCPNCHYGLASPGGAIGTAVCPRASCGHHWSPDSTIAGLVGGVASRVPAHEVEVVAGASPRRIVLASGENIVGRLSGVVVELDNTMVSRRHATIVVEGETATIQDLQSGTGTVIDGEFVDEPRVLQPGDVIVVAGVKLRYEVRFAAAPSQPSPNLAAIVELGRSVDVQMDGKAVTTVPLGAGRLTLGRGANRDLVLPGRLVSSLHAIVEVHGDGVAFVMDAKSTTGTFVNGRPIIRVKLVPGDRLQIGPFVFRFEGDRLIRAELPAALSVTCRGLSVQAGKRTLLDNIALHLPAGEFIGILGPSGAGKSTLLTALNGARPATSGEVLINEAPLYTEYARLRSLIGYVPQDDLVHRDLTVQESVRFAARLRLPKDTSPTEIDRAVSDALECVELADRRGTRVGSLSGGQRKRVGVAVELLGQPGVLFLDEPTSGLDPATESRLMKTFRRMADQGRTIVCTTHGMDHVELFDKVIVVAESGRLAFFGPPSNALRYFSIERFSSLYERLETDTSENWQARFRKSDEYRELIQPVVRGKATGASRKTNLGPEGRGAAFAHQSRVLVERAWRIFLADRSTLAVLILQPLLIALMICVVCQDRFVVDFMLVVSAIWFGCSSGSVQVVGERPVYHRERMVGLRIDSYIASKMLWLCFLTVGQAGLLVLVSAAYRQSADDALLRLMAFGLGAWNGAAIGLAISCLSSRPERASVIVPLSLIPQILLAGVLSPIGEMNGPVDAASHLMASRWANRVTEVAALGGREVSSELLESKNVRPLWNLFPKDDLSTPTGQIEFLKGHSGDIVPGKSLLYQAGLWLSMLLFVTIAVCFWSLLRQDTV